jgi:hypothetical protein
MTASEVTEMMYGSKMEAEGEFEFEEVVLEHF